jgi:hypothetical protein
MLAGIPDYITPQGEAKISFNQIVEGLRLIGARDGPGGSIVLDDVVPVTHILYTLVYLRIFGSLLAFRYDPLTRQLTLFPGFPRTFYGGIAADIFERYPAADRVLHGAQAGPDDLVGFFCLMQFNNGDGSLNIFNGGMAEQSTLYANWLLGNSRNISPLSVNYGFFVELNVPDIPGQAAFTVRDKSIGFYLTIIGVHVRHVVHCGDAVIAFVNQWNPNLAIAVFTAPPRGAGLALADVADWLFTNGILKVDMFPDHVSDNAATIHRGSLCLCSN